MNEYKPIIGLEVHIELATKSKMFCGCPADHFGKTPNTQTCPVCLGLPGALPVPNKKAVDWTIMMGLALGCEINLESKFDRKHYFYPDLPKGYQISQYDQPLCKGGKFSINNSQLTIRIRRVHLEEDTGKLQYAELNGEKVSLVDFNRSGVPLVEIVTEPDISSAEEASDFAKEIQKIARYLGISDCDMEKGSMRLEANISLTDGQQGSLPNYKVELKNINSFRFLQNAIKAELKRQEEILKSGGMILQETRGYNEAKNETFSQRTKEEAQDYRYFPEPDIPPMVFTQDQILKIKKQIPELPNQKKERFISLYGISQTYAEILTEDKTRAEYFDTAAKEGKKHNVTSKTIAGEMVNHNLDKGYPEPAGLIKKLYELSQKEFASYEEMEKAARQVIEANEKARSDYQKGKGQVVGFLVGQVQKDLKGKGDPSKLEGIIVQILRNGQG